MKHAITGGAGEMCHYYVGDLHPTLFTRGRTEKGLFDWLPTAP